MKKTKEYKKIIAYLIMLVGVMIMIIGDNNGFIKHNHFIAHYIIGGLTATFGAYYWCVLDARLERYGRC